MSEGKNTKLIARLQSFAHITFEEPGNAARYMREAAMALAEADTRIAELEDQEIRLVSDAAAIRTVANGIGMSEGPGEGIPYRRATAIEIIEAVSALEQDARDQWEFRQSAETERDAALAVIEQVRAARGNHPECAEHPDGYVISCGWKRAVLDIDTALANPHRANPEPTDSEARRG